jgi:hypothetical protein
LTWRTDGDSLRTHTTRTIEANARDAVTRAPARVIARRERVEKAGRRARGAAHCVIDW